MSDVRLLVISHNCFGKFNNMGKTLEGYFSKWDKASIAQLFFSEEIPNSEICNLFFRVSDSDVLKSVIGKKARGHIVENGLNCSIDSVNTQRKSSSLRNRIVKYARNRTPLVYCMRNALWQLGKWDSVELNEFIDSFNPECVFFAAGDYSFSYKVALKIAQERNIPLVVGCVDDFYMGEKKSVNPLYYWNRRSFMRIVKKTFDYASAFSSICEVMKTEYERLFQRPGIVLYTPVDQVNCSVKNDYYAGDIVYAGNLGYGRAEQLIAIGKALKKIGNPQFPFLHVYSGEIRSKITNQMSKENGIIFHGAVTPKEVELIVSSASFVIHTESFSPRYMSRVKYSISTKIGQCLASGTPIIAYGPSSVASIDYLVSTSSAVCICGSDEIEQKLLSVFNREFDLPQIVETARITAYKNHSKEKTPLEIKRMIQRVVGSEEKR